MVFGKVTVAGSVKYSARLETPRTAR